MTIATEQASRLYKPTWATLAHAVLPLGILLPVELSPGSPYGNTRLKLAQGSWNLVFKKSAQSQTPFAIFPGMNLMSNAIIGESDEGVIFAHLWNDTTPYGTGGIARVANLITKTLGETCEIDTYYLHEPWTSIGQPNFLTDLQRSLGDNIKIREHRVLSLPLIEQQNITGVYANGWFANLVNFEPQYFNDASGLGKYQEIACD